MRRTGKSDSLAATWQLSELRRAAQLGIADIDRGRYRDFNTSAELAQYLRLLANRIVSARRDSR